MSKANLENFKKLISDDKSGWLEKAKWRKENRAWLDKSAKIAVRILSEIRAQKPVNGMTQKKLAEAMNVTPQYINKVVKGKENMTLETIAKIEQVLGISLMEVPTGKTTLSVKAASIDKVDRNTAVTVATKVIKLNTGFTTPTGTNG
ncbi:helix-turn-helix transcriptional regulator [Carboxylicivirga taeanensis]|uniref:helix-turn-helix transcriptional regulator n=1 Tax=Carboxylicivirga taeanensis TaxID=1416875 RepID=UPI003F6E2155